MVLDGRITKEEFNNFALALIEKSQQLNDQWERIEHAVGNNIVHYLRKRNCHRLVEIKQNSSIDDSSMIADDDDQDMVLQNCTTIEPEDNCCTTLPEISNIESNQQVHVYDYHVVYSPAYAVPVLYFDAKTLDGRRLTLDEIWNTVNLEYATNIQYDAWSLISQQEHPLLGRVFFFIHPCHTSDFMNIISGKGSNQKLYLCTWLTAVGPVVGLQLPTSYFI